MFDRDYFVTVVVEQFHWIDYPELGLNVKLDNGEILTVKRVWAAHLNYVVFEIEDGSNPGRGAEWQKTHPGRSPFVFSQIAVPYSRIFHVSLQPLREQPDNRRTPEDHRIGFRIDPEPGDGQGAAVVPEKADAKR